jgi:hypothetical protein
MAPYYLIFLLFLTATLFLRYMVVEVYVTSLPLLIGYAALLFPLLLAVYFLVLFYATRGMKYFVARKPDVYNLLT